MLGKKKESRAVGYFFKFRLETGLHYAMLIVGKKSIEDLIVKNSGMLYIVKNGNAILKTTGTYGGLDVEATFLNFKKKEYSEDPQFTRIKMDYVSYLNNMSQRIEEKIKPPFFCQDIKSFGIFEINGKKQVFPFKND